MIQSQPFTDWPCGPQNTFMRQLPGSGTDGLRYFTKQCYPCKVCSPCCCCSVAQSYLTLCNPVEAAHWPALSFTSPQSLLKLTFIKSMMPSNHLILCHPLLLLPPIFPIIRFFSKESALCVRWPKYWSFSFSISPSNEYSGLISFRLTGLISLLSKGLSRVFSSTTVQKHQLFSVQPSLWTNSHMHT